MLDNLGFRLVNVDGHRFWAHPITGRVLPLVSGADDGEGDGDGGEPPRTFTQDEVDRLLGRTRSEARRSAATELAEQLGCTVEEAKTKIEALAAAEEASKSEAQRALDAAAAARTEAESARAAAAAERAAIKVERALLGAGIPAVVDGKPNPALSRAIGLITVEADADDATVAAEVESLRADLPALFAGTTTAPPPPPSGIAPPRQPPGHGGGTPVEDRVARRLKDLGIKSVA